MDQPLKPLSKAIALIAAGGLLSTGQVLAQSSPVLEEVMVTATKRQESVQDIPISVGVVTGEMMETFSIGDITDIQNFVPGLQVQETFGGTAIRVRGLGSGITNLAFDSSVPIYIDDVYSGRSNTALSAMLDPGRVEVARGPQGALFGKSTTAGAISITSARPTEEFEAQVKLGAEVEIGGYTASGYVSGPLGDNIRARAALLVNDLDGWTENRATGQDDGSEETVAGRLSLEFDSGENTTWYAKFEAGTKDGEGRNSQPVSGTVFPPVGPFLGFIANQNAEIAAGTLEFDADDVRGVATGFPREDFSEYEWNNITLSMESEVAGHGIKVIANHNEYENTYFLDVDGYAAQVLNTYISDDYESDSLEVRFLSPTDQTFEYIGGIWYQTTTVETQQFSPFGTAAPIPVKGNALPYPTGAIRQYDRDADAYSIYGQLTINMSDNFRAILDLRYTDEDQDSNASTRNVAWQTLDNWETPTRDLTRTAGEYAFTQNRSDDSFDPSL
ncbi:MAG: TonB-dependent receptor, partial [Pseudomonadales bacterium]